jgi:broad specificity phosphatase PhoE
MSAEIANNPGNIVTIKITGKLEQSELAQAQQSAAEILKKEGKKRMLVIAEDFQGWGRGDWGDLSGQMLLDQYVERLAIVGDKKWEDLSLLFTGKGIRRVAIEFFAPNDLAKAETWLAE